MSDALLTKDDLLRRVDAGWRAFREQVRHIGRERMNARTAAGWTNKDLLAHVAAWEEEAARRLRGLARGEDVPLMGDDDVDRFNARAVEDRRFVGAEAIVDELETAHRLLVELVRGLPDGVIARERVQRTVAANTYAHYLEHRDELVFTPR